MQVDKNTIESDLRHFARVLVDIDLANELPQTFGVE